MDYLKTDDKLCGVYSPRAHAESAQQQLVTQSGFSDYPDAFLIDGYEVDQAQWTEGFVTVADQP